MNGLSTQWKIFRICCIIQMVLVALQLMFSVVGIFWRNQLIYPITESLAYGLIFIFVYMGLSLLNDNYPDTALTPKQRKNFNWLFLVNFILIAYLFAQVVAEWRRIFPWILEIKVSTRTLVYVISMLAINTIVFVLHLVFLGGMYQLRRVIYQNTMKSFYSPFDEEKK